MTQPRVDVQAAASSGRFERTVDDLVAFNRYFQKQSPTLRRARRRAYWFIGIALGLVAGAYVLTLALPRRASVSPIPLGNWLLVLLAIWMLLLLIGRWEKKRLLRGIYSDASGRNRPGHRTVEITPEGISETTELSLSMVKWSGVEKVALSGDHVFVFVGSASAYIVPRRAFPDDAAFQRFAETARACHRAVAPGPCEHCGYDLTGNVSGRCPECGEAISS